MAIPWAKNDPAKVYSVQRISKILLQHFMQQYREWMPFETSSVTTSNRLLTLNRGAIYWSHHEENTLCFYYMDNESELFGARCDFYCYLISSIDLRIRTKNFWFRYYSVLFGNRYDLRCMINGYYSVVFGDRSDHYCTYFEPWLTHMSA